MSNTWIRGGLSAIAVLVCMNSNTGAQTGCTTSCEADINFLLHITRTEVVPTTNQWKVQPACAFIVRTKVPEGDSASGPVLVQFRRVNNPSGTSNCCDASDQTGTDGTCQSWSGTINPTVTYDIPCWEECIES